MVAPARNRVAAAAARVAPDLDVIFMGILQRKCQGASPASSDSSSRQTAPGASYAVGLVLVTRGAEFISAAGSKQRRARRHRTLVTPDPIDQPLTNLAPMAA